MTARGYPIPRGHHSRFACPALSFSAPSTWRRREVTGKPYGEGATVLCPSSWDCVPQSSPRAGSIYPLGEVVVGCDKEGCFAGRELHLPGGPLVRGQSGVRPSLPVTPSAAASCVDEGGGEMAHASPPSFARSSLSVGTLCNDLSRDHPGGSELRPSPVYAACSLDPT